MNTTINRSGATVKSSVYSQADHIYLNMEIYNGTNAPIVAQTQINFSVPIVDNPNDYYGSIIRFSAPSTDIPIFIYNTTPNYYTVSLEDTEMAGSGPHGGTVYTQSIPYIPENSLGNYTIFSYQGWLNCINQAITTAFTALKTADPSNPAVHPPVMLLDISGQLVQIAFPTTGYTGSPAPVYLYMNDILFHFFESFQIIDNGTDAMNNNATSNQIVCQDSGNNYLVVNTPSVGSNGIFYSPATLPSGTYYLMSEEFQTLPLWNSFTSMVITATGMPIRTEYLPNTGQNMNIQPIFTDFFPIIQTVSDARSQFQYTPSGEYRLVDLLSTEPLRNFAIQVNWTDEVQNIYPLMIPPTDYVSIKFLFRRRGVPYTPVKELDRDGSMKSH